jgi:hypothetical protein
MKLSNLRNIVESNSVTNLHEADPLSGYDPWVINMFNQWNAMQDTGSPFQMPGGRGRGGGYITPTFLPGGIPAPVIDPIFLDWWQEFLDNWNESYPEGMPNRPPVPNFIFRETQDGLPYVMDEDGRVVYPPGYNPDFPESHPNHPDYDPDRKFPGLDQFDRPAVTRPTMDIPADRGIGSGSGGRGGGSLGRRVPPLKYFDGGRGGGRGGRFGKGI